MIYTATISITISSVLTFRMAGCGGMQTRQKQTQQEHQEGRWAGGEKARK